MSINRTDPTITSNYIAFPYVIKPTKWQESVAKVAAIALHVFLSIATVGIYWLVTLLKVINDTSDPNPSGTPPLSHRTNSLGQAALSPSKKESNSELTSESEDKIEEEPRSIGPCLDDQKVEASIVPKKEEEQLLVESDDEVEAPSAIALPAEAVLKVKQQLLDCADQIEVLLAPARMLTQLKKSKDQPAVFYTNLVKLNVMGHVYHKDPLFILTDEYMLERLTDMGIMKILYNNRNLTELHLGKLSQEQAEELIQKEIASVKSTAKPELVDLFRRSILAGIRMRQANTEIKDMFREAMSLMNTQPYDKLQVFFKRYINLISTITQNFTDADSFITLLRYEVSQKTCNEMSDKFENVDEQGFLDLQKEMREFAATL